MSELMYNEVPVVGDHYTFGDWKLYAKHDDYNVCGFFGPYRWLSNFHECPVYFEGLEYPSSENAYQAAKVDKDFRHHLQKITASEVKRAWKKLPLIDMCYGDWDDRKYDVMSVILFDKFYRNKDLRQKLIDTEDKYLEESNHWKDQDWGVDINLGGKNYLGKILMKIRGYWK
jgi:hypothetical protein